MALYLHTYTEYTLILKCTYQVETVRFLLFMAFNKLCPYLFQFKYMYLQSSLVFTTSASCGEKCIQFVNIGCVCLFVCLSGNEITLKVVDQFLQNLMGRYCIKRSYRFHSNLTSVLANQMSPINDWVLSDWVHFTDFLKGGCLSVLL